MILMRVTIDLADAMLLTNGCLSCLEPTSNHQRIAYRIAGFYLQEGSKTTRRNLLITQM